MTTTLDIQGTCEPRFSAVRDAFADNFARGHEVGASVSITLNGATVVDLWAGSADEAGSRPWTHDTLVNVYSCTKGLGAICAHMLVDRGKLDLDAPVATYWPEFAQAGKASLPVRYLLSHRAGLPAITRTLPPETLYDWDAMCAALAAQAPWWEPGSAHGYHALTYAWLVGEVVRRVDGRSIGTFFRDEVAQPLGLDAHIGCGLELEARIAELLPSPPPPPGQVDLLAEMMADKDSMSAKAFGNPPVLGRTTVNSRAWRAAEICSANGHANARSLARFYAALGAWTRGETFAGVRLMTQQGMEQARTEQSAGMDQVLRLENRIALGFMLPSPMRRFAENPRAFGHAGAGGSLGFTDPEHRLSFGYAMNQMQSGGPGGDGRWWGLIQGMYEAIGVPFTPPGGDGHGTSVG
jgi:CubicO group peptidase (beta-lactamase class C family)